MQNEITTVAAKLGIKVSVVVGIGHKTGKEFATLVLRSEDTSKAGRAALIANKDALVAALRTAGFKAKKGDGLRYTGSEFTSVNTGVRYEFLAVRA